MDYQRFARDFVTNKTRYVKTPAGERKFGEPIGSPIVPGKGSSLADISHRSEANRKARKQRAVDAVKDLPAPGDRHKRSAQLQVERWARSERSSAKGSRTQQTEDRVTAGILRSDPDSDETYFEELSGFRKTPTSAEKQARRRAQNLMRDYMDTELGPNNESREMETRRLEKRERLRAQLDEFYAHGLMAAADKRRIEQGSHNDPKSRINTLASTVPQSEVEWKKAVGTHGKDPNGVPVPSDELKRHLDSTLQVGNVVLDEFDRVMEPRRQERQQLANNVEQLRVAAKAEHAAAMAKAESEPETKNDEFGGMFSLLDKLMALPNPDETALAKAEAELQAFDRQTQREERKALDGVVRALRPFGGVPQKINPQTKNSTKPPRDWHVKAVRDAEQVYPDGWLQRANERGELTLADSTKSGVASFSPVEAQLWDPKSKTVTKKKIDTIALPSSPEAFSESPAFGDYWTQTAAHEMGHRMEQAVPGLSALEYAFLRQRTTGPDGVVDGLTDYMSGSNTKVYEDKFSDSYTGRSYYQGTKQDPAEATWEVFQRGIEETFGRLNGKHADRELQAFVLGSMMTLGRD